MANKRFDSFLVALISHKLTTMTEIRDFHNDSKKSIDDRLKYWMTNKKYSKVTSQLSYTVYTFVVNTTKFLILFGGFSCTLVRS